MKPESRTHAVHERTHISSIDDPRVSHFRNVRDADLNRQQAFIVEARFNVQTLLSADSKFRPAAVLGTPVALNAITEQLNAADPTTQIYEATQDTMDAIVGFHIHRGLLALAQRSPVPDANTLLSKLNHPNRVVVVEDLTNHDNMGAIFRNAAAFGAAAVLITPRCCDPLYRKSIRVSMGHALTTPFAYVQMGTQGIQSLASLGYESIALTPANDATPINTAAEAIDPATKLALWLGHEGKGLSAQAINTAHHTVRIPIASHVDSLNTATALGIALHRFSAL